MFSRRKISPTRISIFQIAVPGVGGRASVVARWLYRNIIINSFFFFCFRFVFCLTPAISVFFFFFCYSSFINTMVTATLMEPQALDLSTHSRNKCKSCKLSLTATATAATAQKSPKISRHIFLPKTVQTVRMQVHRRHTRRAGRRALCTVPEKPYLDNYYDNCRRAVDNK